MAHIGNMKKYFPPSQIRLAEIERQQEANGPKTTVSTEEYEVDEIVDDNEIDGEQCYRVHWKGYDSTHDTWEPIGHLANAKEKVQKYLANNRKV